jgi:hypothetical protein
MAGALLLCFAPLCFAELSFTVDAGFDGYYRVGAWLPVRIAVENTGSDRSGFFAVTWDQSRFRQAVDLPAPTRRSLEFYVLASSGVTQLDVDFVDASGAVDRVSVEVWPLLPDEQLRLVGTHTSSLESFQSPGRLEVFVPAQLWPYRWMGLDGVDELGPADRSLSDVWTADQIAAVDTWTRLRSPHGTGPDRWSSDRAVLDSVRDVLSPDMPASGAAGSWVLGIGLVLSAILIAPLGRRIGRVRPDLLAIAALVGAVILLIRFAPASAVTVSESGAVLIHSYPDREDSFVSMLVVSHAGGRGILRRTPSGDGVIEVESSPGSVDHVFAGDGSATVEVPVVLGDRLVYRSSLVRPSNPLTVRFDSSTVSVSNHGADRLDPCFARSGGVLYVLPAIAAGESAGPFALSGQRQRESFFERPTIAERLVSRVLSSSGTEPLVVCVVPSAGDTSLSPGATVLRGPTVLVGHMENTAGETAP